MKLDLSVVVITKNEAANIRRCLESVAWCDDILVVDDHSEDQTVNVAQDLGARVVSHRFENFACQRNWALASGHLRHPWVLMLDADEALTPGVRDEIVSALAAADASMAGFLLCRKTMFMDRWLRHSDGFPVWIMRLVHRDRARFAESGHGDVPAPPVDGLLGEIHEPFLHYPFSRGLAHWIARHNAYSTREAELEARSTLQWSWREILWSRAPKRRMALRNLARELPFRPFLRFFYQYFWKRGFLDGRAGVDFSLLMAVYEGMIVLKRREIELALLAAKEDPGDKAKEDLPSRVGHSDRPSLDLGEVSDDRCQKAGRRERGSQA